ncbi:MAG: hypothetical protein U9O95_04530 [Candidatus Marinimicrobia bacterium]|nr:hypothetical protein [Candidatus Neomarinimicrobiota bacterium]
MKKSVRHIQKILFMLLLLFIACSPSRKNELVYRYYLNENAVSLDSLKSEILGTSGAEMLVVYPDSDVVIIHYDRFKTHQDIIESCFKECGYKITLVKKSKIEEKDQPWQKK